VNLRPIGSFLAIVLSIAALLLSRSLLDAAATAPARARCADVDSSGIRIAALTDPTGRNAGSTAVQKLAGALTVFAASSLQEAFTDIASELQARNPDLRITLNFAGSSVLRAQLAQGARADVFAAADEPTIRRAIQDGVAVEPARVFARNELAIITPATGLRTISSPVDLARPGLKLVLAQRDVPAGGYARQAIARLGTSAGMGPGFEERVLANVVSEEMNVRQVVAKVALGEADAGIVYASDITPAVRPRIAVVPFPAPASVAVSYPVARVASGSCPARAAAFIDYLLSPDGQATLSRNGFRAAID
jgi:molybdate transport system substrate-binding protein